MSYDKYTWQTGEVITAAKLNHIEDGIAAIGSVQHTIEVTGGKVVFKAANNAVKAGDTGVVTGPDGKQVCFIVAKTEPDQNGPEHFDTITIGDNEPLQPVVNKWVYSDENDGFIIDNIG